MWDLALMAAAFLLYYLVRGLVVERASEATSRAIGLVELEQRLGLFWELQMQAWIMSSDLLIRFFNAIYVYAHFPLIVVVGLWLFFFHRQQYVRYRNAFLISGAIGLLIFNLFPTAPPRLLPPVYAVVDTMAAFSPINYDMQPAAFVNKYAAMPSLHLGWNLLLGLAIIAASASPLLRAFAVLMPLAMAMAVVVTGNHFILDVVVGVVVALLGLWGAVALERHGGRLRRALLRRLAPRASDA